MPNAHAENTGTRKRRRPEEVPALDTKSDNDAIVFRAPDFVDPAASAVFSELFGKPALATHAQGFASICRAPFERTPSLDDFLAGRNIPASIIQITAKPQEGRPKPGYVGVYDVLLATNYETCLRRVGDKVEVIGRIVAVKEDSARNGKPYVFINFGDWRGQIFKIAIWSEGHRWRDPSAPVCCAATASVEWCWSTGH